MHQTLALNVHWPQRRPSLGGALQMPSLAPTYCSCFR